MGAAAAAPGTRKRAYVLVVDNGKLVRRAVTLGLKTDDASFVEVREGLRVGTQVLAAKIDALVAEGRLRFVAGRIVGAEAEGGGALLTWRPRGSAGTETTSARRIVNCTGPQGDLLRSSDPLVRRLLGAKRIRPDALRLGLDIDRDGHIVDAAGKASEHILAIGPMTRGDLWEVVAVPDIRNQVSALETGIVREAEAALKVAEAAYRFGERGILDFLDAQRVFRAVRNELISARFELSAAVVEIERLSAVR